MKVRPWWFGFWPIVVVVLAMFGLVLLFIPKARAGEIAESHGCLRDNQEWYVEIEYRTNMATSPRVNIYRNQLLAAGCTMNRPQPNALGKCFVNLKRARKYPRECLMFGDESTTIRSHEPTPESSIAAIREYFGLGEKRAKK